MRNVYGIPRCLLRNYEALRYAAQERPERSKRSGRLIPFLLVSLAAPATRNSG